jgi:diguanylate cyclase (GGDEF)-like protein/PAS domain S-box-containing protein
MVSKPTKPISVLLVEDDEDDYLITRDMLRAQERVSCTVEWLASYDRALRAIREARHDVYIVDYRLGEKTGLQLIREAIAGHPHAPVIMLTGESDYGIDLEASELGVTDYLLKQELDAIGLERSIRYAISHHRAIRELARSEERYALAASAANDGIWDWDLSSDELYISPRWRAILGHPQAGGVQEPSVWFELVHDDDLPELRAAVDAHLGGRTAHLESEHRIRHHDGSWRWVLARGLAMRDGAGRATRVAGSLTDVTDRRAAEQRLRHGTLHDDLTGLPNRALFMDRVAQALRRRTREARVKPAILFVDIDGFKLVNDSLGHDAGDQLLVALARRLTEAMGPEDTVARIGGDEFTLLLDDVKDHRDAMALARRLQMLLAEPFEVGGRELFVSASIGISHRSRSLGADELLRNADIAMFDAKRRGRGRCTVFDESMHRRVVERLVRENELRHAVEQALLEVHYQPIVDLSTGRIRALEALARWPTGWGEVTPPEFILIAEETGMIGALGMHVLRAALADLASWRRQRLIDDDVCVSVNISSRQFEAPDLFGDIRAAIAAAGLPADALRLEITESTLMQDPGRTAAIVSQICATGVGLHLDDFGTGYSSLATLNQFPFDALKIDRSFVGSITPGDGDGAGDVLVRSTVALAHSLGLSVIAEGIEEPEQVRRLRALGCEYGQGFLFSPAVSADGIRGLLAEWSPAPGALVAQPA